MSAAGRFVRENALSLTFGGLFVASLVGQAVAGWKQFNAEHLTTGLGTIGLWDYVTSPDFSVDVTENWQSEYLQFFLFILATVWLVQKGSTESKPPGEEGTESDKEQQVGRYAEKDSPRWAKPGGWRTALYSSSLLLVMGAIFLLSWFVQSVAGWAAYNETRLEDLQGPVSYGGYLLDPDFWSRTLQNWQSEFLAVGSMAVFSIYLRQRGSSQSKPVGSPHATTGDEG